MDYQKQINRFLNRKAAISVLGKDFVLSDLQKKRLIALLKEVGSVNKMQDMIKTVATFIKCDLTNYKGRYKRLKGISGTSKYTQYLRYGRYAKDVYIKQSKSKTHHFDNIVKNWINRGYTIEEATEKVKNIQKERNKLSVQKVSGTSLYTVRSKLYWLSKGYTQEEATEKVKNIQTKNGIEWYKRKYPDSFEEKFKERIEKWKESLKNNNDIDFLSFKKGHSVKAGIARGLTIEEAIEHYNKIVDNLRKIRRKPSKISQKLFELLENKIDGQSYFANKNYEYLIEKYRVDYYNKKHKLVIEFYGDYYHMNPKIYTNEDYVFGMKATDRWEYDKKRIELIKSSVKVDKVIIVWDSEFRKNPDTVVENIIKEIKNE